MENHTILKALLIIFQTGLFISPSFGEEIKQEFNSKADFNSFWDISTWNDSQQQYSANNVMLDTAHGWMRLKINASPQGTKPVNGEITSKRNNFLYGSYRASIKFDNIPGGVVGWFVYRTTEDLHEIDVEYLTQDITHIHFTLHHIQTDVDYRKVAITFDPTAAFHEYRFDWYANKVVYFIDGKKIDSLTNKVPDAACSIMLNFWSANIAGWGGPAPTKDAYMYVDYMHYYSDPATATKLKAVSQPNLLRPITVSQNHNSVSIQFETIRPGKVVLSVFNMLGKKVYEIASASAQTGVRHLYWDASECADGTYLFELTENGIERNSILHVTKQP